MQLLRELERICDIIVTMKTSDWITKWVPGIIAQSNFESENGKKSLTAIIDMTTSLGKFTFQRVLAFWLTKTVQHLRT